MPLRIVVYFSVIEIQSAKQLLGGLYRHFKDVKANQILAKNTFANYRATLLVPVGTAPIRTLSRIGRAAEPKPILRLVVVINLAKST
jgi:hypothetical protein